MPVFSVTVPQVASDNVANAFTTLVGLKLANTAGHRGRLRKIKISGGGGAAQDEQLTVHLRRSDNTGDGTSTAVNVNTIGKHDEGSVASNVTAIGKTYTVEPTNKGNELLGVGGTNTRGVLDLDWTADMDHAPQWGIDQQLCIEGAPGQVVVLDLTVAVEWEEF